MAEVIRPSSTTALNLTQGLNIAFQANEKDQAWVRWIHASINKHFMTKKGPLPMYIEGDERTLQSEAEFYELRIDGPYILQTQKDFYYFDVEINVLVQTHMDHSRLYKTQDAIGYIIVLLKTLYAFLNGDGQFDDQTLLGVLRLRTKINESLDINYFGIIKEDTRITQATVEGHYRMEISNGSN